MTTPYPVKVEGGMVIIGGGKAGARAVVALREEGWEGAITLIASEAHAPYDRPPLSKSTITDDEIPALALLVDEEILASIKVKFIKGKAATSIDRDSKTVQLADGTSIAYDKLLIATGAQPRRLNIEGSHSERILYLRTFEDSLAIRRLMDKGSHVIIIGGGFIGLELAASVRKRGLAVTVVEGLLRVLARGVPAEIAERVSEEHINEGVNILCGVSVAGFHDDGYSLTIRLNNGIEIKGDFAVVGIGAVPVTNLAEAAGLKIENGIAVDEYLATNDPDIFAAGDCASFPLAAYDGRRVRLESWRSAQDHGAIAAANMLGKNVALTVVPWFWSDQFDLVLQIAGLADGASQTVRRDLGNGAFVQFHLAANGRLLAASGIGVGNAVAKDIRLAEMMISKHLSPAPELLADPAVNLKSLLKG